MRRLSERTSSGREPRAAGDNVGRTVDLLTNISERWAAPRRRISRHAHKPGFAVVGAGARPEESARRRQSVRRGASASVPRHCGAILIRLLAWGQHLAKQARGSDPALLAPHGVVESTDKHGGRAFGRMKLRRREAVEFQEQVGFPYRRSAGDS